MRPMAIQMATIILLAHMSLVASLTLPPTLVVGPGSLEVRLITAKLAAQAGHTAALYSGGDAKAEQAWRKLMYGKDYSDAGVDVNESAAIISSVEDLGRFLSTAGVVCIVADSQPLAEGTCNTLLKNAPNVQRVVMVSRIGLTRAEPGPFGLGGSDVALRKSEDDIRAAVASRGLELSVLRVGTLKGGGSGALEAGELVGSGSGDLGLHPCYYDTLAELETYMCTQSFDKFTNGAVLTPGDPYDLPNPLSRAANRGSFEPNDAETSRIAAAAAATYALSYPSALEITLSSAKATQPPTVDEWKAMFDSAAAAAA